MEGLWVSEENSMATFSFTDHEVELIQDAIIDFLEDRPHLENGDSAEYDTILEKLGLAPDPKTKKDEKA